MCGIVGYLGQGDRDILNKMTNSLTHRGPDDSGFFIDGDLGLGHRRLAIIDITASGHQPMFSVNGRLAIIFNGEIYNFQLLREEMIKKGYQFRSASDTEVILALYQEYGGDCFAKMNGMFALGIYDQAKRRLVLARDRLGKKPLYWTVLGQTIIFGSELKALLAHPLLKKEIDLTSLNKYLAFDYIPTPHTIFKCVYKLEPGHYLTYQDGVAKKTQFWDIKFNADPVALELSRRGSLEDILLEMNARLEQAVTSRLVSDVPLGIFLSGGLDSSTIAYYAQKQSKEKIKTFSIGFTEKSFDESAYAREVARFLDTEHHEQILTAEDSLALIPELGKFIDEPVADYSFIPTYLLSRFTKQQVTVALGGDGGDELFFGYPTLVADKFAERLAPWTRLTKRLLEQFLCVIPVSHQNFNLAFKIERFLAGIDSPRQYRHHAWMGTFGGPDDRAKLLLPEIQNNLESANVYEDVDRYHAQIASEPWYNQLIYLYLRTYLMDQVLVKVDRTSMAASLEVRAPFLDYKFVDFVNSIDSTFKMHGWQTKYLLKCLMFDKLPKKIVNRKKQGFGVPLSLWFTRELKSFVLETLSSDQIRQGGLFNFIAVQKILSDHFNHRRDNRKQIWSLLVWQMWQKTWL